MNNRKETDLRTRVLKHLYSIPFYHDLPRERKNEMYDETMRRFAEEDFCREHGITKIFEEINEPASSVMYCGTKIEFSDPRDVDNFIAYMYELSMCCMGKY